MTSPTTGATGTTPATTSPTATTRTTGAARPAAAATAERVRADYAALKARGLALDLTRGKPSPAQLDLSTGLLDIGAAELGPAGAGADHRNYGGLTGLPELRAIFAEVLRVPVEQLLAVGNSSLALMHDTLVHAVLFGVPGSARPWGAERTAVLCPVPGYDRHFALCEKFGLEMIPVPMRDDGPDMDEVERLAAADPGIRAIWCVPTYSNPTGAVYGPETARRLAALPAAAPDFRILWDDAYAVHHLTDEHGEHGEHGEHEQHEQHERDEHGDHTPPGAPGTTPPGGAAPAPGILALCAEHGHPDRAFVYGSTSKITFAGAGVAFLGSSPANVEWLTGHLSRRTIGPDKLNQLRHARFLRDAAGLRAHMARHRALLRPRFDLVERVLRERLGGLDGATWSRPRGGYFVSLDVPDGCARRTVELAAEAGIRLTPAGATFPYGRDPRDRNIRIAPTYPALDELETAMEGLAVCVLLAALERS
ncbi:aminotransferase class I/II-fold pyridoxal phosphate-dependent enzyme [Streptomyces fradiae]|uniref:aminotransferase class I/II-fold pyridoxal phosphate-dependent enzyme n=1 Tax=Streptomyces fradiae TaxID=1906 RepID=UPI003411B9DD